MCRSETSHFWIQYPISLSFFLHFHEVRGDGRWESESEGRWNKARRLCYLLQYLLHRDDCVPWLEATSFESGKTPHELHSTHPPSLSLTRSLSLQILPWLFIFLFSPTELGLSAWLSLFLLVSPLSHVPVSEHYQQHGMCRRGMKSICHCFYIYALFVLPHAALSVTVSLSLSVFPALLLCSVTPLHLMSWKTNRHFINFGNGGVFSMAPVVSVRKLDSIRPKTWRTDTFLWPYSYTPSRPFSKSVHWADFNT